MFIKKSYIKSVSTLNYYFLCKDVSNKADWEIYDDWLHTTGSKVSSLSEACEILDYISSSKDLPLSALTCAASISDIPSIGHYAKGIDNDRVI